VGEYLEGRRQWDLLDPDWRAVLEFATEARKERTDLARKERRNLGNRKWRSLGVRYPSFSNAKEREGELLEGGKNGNHLSGWRAKPHMGSVQRSVRSEEQEKQTRIFYNARSRKG